MIDHTYKGQQIVRSNCAESKRWRIVSTHPTGTPFAEEPGEGYNTLTEARAAIDQYGLGRVQEDKP